ncbi:MAG TPA: hypothetical protein VFU88_20440 [Ktedonobacterales bacterium]|nr:hypothetical protein [Ktedonobacterales bacterium]
MSTNMAGARAARRRNHRLGWKTLLTAALLALALIVAACGTTTSPGGNGNTPTARPATTVKVYFAHHPETDEHPDQVFAVTRTIPHDLVQPNDIAAFALQQMLQGPTAAEQTQGYYSPFSGALALMSTCPGEFRDFDLAHDRRGTKAEQGTVTMRFCRRVDIAGDLDGPRMKSMINQTLLQFSNIHQVVVLDWNGNCFDDMIGDNRCLTSTPSGYPVKVYFSRHPDSDARPAAVFAVDRTSPTLGVATYSIAQLVAGPLPSEKSQGYFTPLEGALSGTSNCAGADFRITLDTNRTHPETGTTTLQFCRSMRGLGDTPSVMARNEIVTTLMQFANIKKVVITNADGSCFDDLIGCD